MTILSKKKIREFCEGDSASCPLISEFNLENCKGASYDLTLGDEYILLGQNKDSNTLSPTPLENKNFRLQATQVAYLISKESISLPHNITAQVALRMRYISAGVMLAPPPPIDPGYNGKVVAMLHNLSTEDVVFRSGDRFLSIIFNLVEGNDNPLKVEDKSPQTELNSLSDLVPFPKAGAGLYQIFAEVKKSKQELDKQLVENRDFAFKMFSYVTAATSIAIAGMAFIAAYKIVN